MPATTSSISFAEIFTPVAATTSFTEVNFAFLSLISTKGLGWNNAFTFVTIGSVKEPITIVSFIFKQPSYRIVSIVFPRPLSSFTSRIIPFAGDCLLHSKLDPKYF